MMSFLSAVIKSNVLFPTDIEGKTSEIEIPTRKVLCERNVEKVAHFYSFQIKVCLPCTN
jgi:hypothetical protein